MRKKLLLWLSFFLFLVLNVEAFYFPYIFKTARFSLRLEPFILLSFSFTLPLLMLFEWMLPCTQLSSWFLECITFVFIHLMCLWPFFDSDKLKITLGSSLVWSIKLGYALWSNWSILFFFKKITIKNTYKIYCHNHF